MLLKKNKKKKIRLIFFFSIFLAFFVFSFNCFASSISAGSATLTPGQGEVWDVFGSNRHWYKNGFVEDSADSNEIVYGFSDVQSPAYSPTGSPVATYAHFYFSGSSYGTLILTYQSSSGSVYYDSFNGLYDSNNNKLADFTVQGHTYVLNYTGEMLPEFSVNAYFTTPSGTYETLFTILNISFIDESPANIKQYSAPNTSQTDAFTSAESSLMDSTATYRNESLLWFSRLGNLISLTSTLGKGMLSMTYIVERLIDIPYVNAIVSYSFIIGLIAFILGLGGVFGALHRFNNNRR